MAALSRRPRAILGALLALSLAGSACSLVQPAETPVDLQEQAVRLAREGKHAEAAQRYAQLATQSPTDHDNFQLLATEQWVAANDLNAAKQAFAGLSPEAHTHLPTARALVAAELAYAQNDGVGAIRELDTIAVPSVPDQAQNYWWLRGRSAFLTGHPLEGTRALVERERFLADPGALRGNREELFNRIKSAAEHGQSLKYPPKTEAVIAGWLDVGSVAVELSRNPLHAAPALANWRRQYPQHPANDSTLTVVQTQAVTLANAYPSQIALLLPLSGRGEAVGVAVRDGFIAAYLQQDAAGRPKLKVYDVAVQSAAEAYDQAIADGAGFVVGPLTKEDVATIAPLSAGRTPVLALNFLADNLNAPREFYQFALLPEDEARMVARRVVADGRPNGVALVPTGEWGSRVAGAFSEELKRLGGNLLDVQHYEPAQVDFSEAIKTLMQVHNVKGEPVTHRTDANFIFVAAGTASTARLILPQLKFHYSGDVPAYATSDSFEPDNGANSDIDGMFFPDMPWMVANDEATTQIRDSVRQAWPSRTSRRDRLYAFGFDAYRLVPALRAKTPLDGQINGVTGRLHLDAGNHVRRDLDWAQIKGGLPNAL
jgi:outer membrane PBP1 activator LpoA protein